MIELSADRLAFTPAPPLAPELCIDADHLARMTLGDRMLEREVLHLFDMQSALLVERMRHVPASGIATCAHTLKGSARGIGAWRIAEAAERVEQGAAGCDPQLGAALQELTHLVGEAHEAISRMLQ